MQAIQRTFIKLPEMRNPSKKLISSLVVQKRLRSVTSRVNRFFFQKNLLFTNSISSGICMFLGDLVQQEVEYRSNILHERYDWLRSGRMFIVGTLLGPFHHYYYINLDKYIPKATLATALQKIIFDQLFASPLTIVGFFYGIGLLEGKSTEKIISEIKDKAVYVYIGDCLFWPPIQFINFYYLATKYRVLYINIATMIFNIFLSYMKYDFIEKRH